MTEGRGYHLIRTDIRDESLGVPGAVPVEGDIGICICCCCCAFWTLKGGKWASYTPTAEELWRAAELIAAEKIRLARGAILN